jgi:hypothetical protein
VQQWRVKPGEFQEEFPLRIADTDLIEHKQKVIELNTSSQVFLIDADNSPPFESRIKITINLGRRNKTMIPVASKIFF